MKQKWFIILFPQTQDMISDRRTDVDYISILLLTTEQIVRKCFRLSSSLRSSLYLLCRFPYLTRGGWSRNRTVGSPSWVRDSVVFHQRLELRFTGLNLGVYVDSGFTDFTLLESEERNSWKSFTSANFAKVFIQEYHYDSPLCLECTNHELIILKKGTRLGMVLGSARVIGCCNHEKRWLYTC